MPAYYPGLNPLPVILSSFRFSEGASGVIRNFEKVLGFVLLGLGLGGARLLVWGW
jgi:hypothetical protein